MLPYAARGFQVATLQYMVQALAQKPAGEGTMTVPALIYSFWLSFSVLDFSLLPALRTDIHCLRKHTQSNRTKNCPSDSRQQQIELTNLRARHGVQDVFHG